MQQQAVNPAPVAPRASTVLIHHLPYQPTALLAGLLIHQAGLTAQNAQWVSYNNNNNNCIYIAPNTSKTKLLRAQEKTTYTMN